MAKDNLRLLPYLLGFTGQQYDFWLSVNFVFHRGFMQTISPSLPAASAEGGNIVVVMASDRLFSNNGKSKLGGVDAICIDWDECVRTGKKSKAMSWIAKGNAYGKQVITVGTESNLTGSAELTEVDVTFIARTQINNARGDKVVRAVSEALDALYAPFDRTPRGFIPKGSQSSDADLDSLSRPSPSVGIDPEYTRPLLNLAQKRALIRWLNSPDVE